MQFSSTSTKIAQSGNCDKNVGLMEELALRLTIVGAAGMAFPGISFALLTRSQAIMLDGLFSLISFARGFLSLRVAKLVKRPVVLTTWARGNSQSESA